MIPQSLLLPLLALAAAAEPTTPVERAEVSFTSDDAKNNVPDRFRLEPHKFTVKVQRKFDLVHSGVEVFDVQFPSPVMSPHEVNNTVYAEYFRPKGVKGKIPAVLVLDILQGNGMVSRGEAMWLAQNGIAALAITMPYYGNRRPTEGKHRMLTTDVDQSVANVRQVVLDCRRAVAWLATQPEVDDTRLGVVGTSLGSFMGGLLAAGEPRLTRICLLLGGGGLVDAFYNHPQAGLIARALELGGLSRKALEQIIAPIDPLTYADRLKGRKLLLIGASRDDVVPPAALTKLWEATGKPKILWYDATHVGFAVYAFPAMQAVITHIKE